MAITKRCPNCGQSISADSAFCTYCGHPISDAISRPTMNQKKKSSHLGLKIAAAIIAVLAALFAVVVIKWQQEGEIAEQGKVTLSNMAVGNPDGSRNSFNPFTGSNYSSQQEENDQPEDNHQPSMSETGKTDMSIGETSNVGAVSAGLSYVKRMDALPTHLGSVDNDVVPGTEVILGFFDFHNRDDAPVRVEPGDITCYADGVQVQPVEKYLKVECDGVKQFDSVSIEANTGLCSVQDFAVPSGWNELKFFYGSHCSWIVHQDEVSADNFIMHSMYDDVGLNYDITQPGMGISTSDHQIIFDDAGLYSNYNMFLGGTNYVVFKFRVNNTSSAVLDYSLVGYNMSAYCNGYLLDDTPEILTNESIDGYSNIFDVDSIAPGMSANIYVAFECAGDNGTYSLVYDEGYIVHEQLGVVTVDLQYDIGTEGEIAEQGRTTLADIAGDTSYDPFTGTTD